MKTKYINQIKTAAIPPAIIFEKTVDINSIFMQIYEKNLIYHAYESNLVTITHRKPFSTIHRIKLTCASQIPQILDN